MTENIKQKILTELNKKDFPDLKLIFSEDALSIAPALLEELLTEEKKDFEEKLKVKNENITFDTFEDFSLLDYFWGLLNHLKNVNSSDKIRKIIEDFRPKLQDFWNEIAYNKRYYDMLVYCDENNMLDEEQKRVMFLALKAYKDRGINLSEEKQNRLKELNKILSELSDKFSNNIVDDEENFEYLIEDFEIIKELPEDVLENAKRLAEEKNKKGYLFTADPTAYGAIMQYCTDREVRKYFENSRNKTASEGKFDNRGVILDILKYKREKAEILWYNNYAELSLNDKMADSPEKVLELIWWISEKARKKAASELDMLKKHFSLEEITPYDTAFYSRKFKQEKYSVDDKELKKYFCFENTLAYLFDFVNKFYWLELKQIEVDSYNEDVRLYEVYKDGKLISYYLLDPFYRKEKRGWAWADNLREKFEDKIPFVVNVCNFQKSEKDILLTIRDTETIFHEFGHAIHEILSVSKHSELSWFWVEWDFVELPSQILENWVGERDSLKLLAKHYKTGEKLSEDILDKLDELKTYMSWAFVTRQNEFALMDMNLYSSEIPSSVEELDRLVLSLVNRFSLFERGEDYKMYTSFGHIFGGGYAAWYYSYMWAEIIEADTFAEIKKLWMFDRSVWEKFINSILGQWTKKPARELFYDFMWREVDSKAFMERKWL